MFKDFPDIIKNIDLDTAMNEVDELRMYESDWMKQTSKCFEVEQLEFIEKQNRYTITNQEVPFECLFFPNSNKKLYVSLSYGRSEYKYPIFARWKYKNWLQGNLLCIDDPMYYFHKNYKHVLWYYGTKDKSYLHLLIDIVKKAMKLLDIDSKDVIFLGSSGGGYAALYCANILDYSKALAFNPQIVIKNWKEDKIKKDFKEMSIDLSSEDRLNRNVIKLTNKKSNYFILMNAKSEDEYQKQFLPFMQGHNIPVKYGISQNGNIVTWLHSVASSNPHSTFFGKVGCRLAEYLLYKVEDGCDLNQYSNVSMLINEVLDEKYKLSDEKDLTKEKLKTIGSYFINYISEIVIYGLYKRISALNDKQVNFMFGDNIKIAKKVIDEGNIEYSVGHLNKVLYNIFYRDGNIFLRMKFYDFYKNVDIADKIIKAMDTSHKDYTNYKITNKETLFIIKKLKVGQEILEINSFIDFTLGLFSC